MLWPALFTLFVWWFCTVLILYLIGRNERTYRFSLIGASLAAAGAVVVLFHTRANTTVASAYLAFTCSIVIWGLVETSFLTGIITGPRRTPCPPGASGWRAAKYAFQAIQHHEIALLAAGAVIFAITWGGANHVGAATFITLWVARQSAKLNLFLGVRNHSEEFLPEHLRYLQSYFTRRSMNILFPISMTLGVCVVWALITSATSVTASAFDTVAATLLASLALLAIVEHWFMVIPVPTTALWQWGLRGRETKP